MQRISTPTNYVPKLWERDPRGDNLSRPEDILKNKYHEHLATISLYSILLKTASLTVSSFSNTSIFLLYSALKKGLWTFSDVGPSTRVVTLYSVACGSVCCCYELINRSYIGESLSHCFFAIAIIVSLPQFQAIYDTTYVAEDSAMNITLFLALASVCLDRWTYEGDLRTRLHGIMSSKSSFLRTSYTLILGSRLQDQDNARAFLLISMAANVLWPLAAVSIRYYSKTPEVFGCFVFVLGMILCYVSIWIPGQNEVLYNVIPMVWFNLTFSLPLLFWMVRSQSIAFDMP